MPWISRQNNAASRKNARQMATAAMGLRLSLLLIVLLAGSTKMLTAQAGVFVCPNGTSSGLGDTATAAQYNAACGLGGLGGSSPGTGRPLSGQALRNQMNQQMMQGMTNAFMQGAINGFMNSLHRSEAMRQQQQLLFQQQMQQQQQQAIEQEQLAEQQRINAMFARLNSEMKFGQGLESLHMKGMDDNGSDALHMKLGDDDATADSYGIKGLPGTYVGGPAGDATTNSGAGDNAASGGSNPNLVSGPGSGTTGPGIPGLPGIYLDGAQPEQAAPLAQAAQMVPAGPERDLEEDTALHAAQNNPALTGQTQDPQVQQFQQDNQNYQQALQTTAQARQQLAGAQSEVTADQSAIATAKAQLASLQPTEEQQAALQKMLDVAKSDEDASEAARKIFENADAHLSIARTQAIQSLAKTAPPAPNAGALLANLNAAPHLLCAPQFAAASSQAMGTTVKSWPAQPLPAPPLATPMSPARAKICAQLTGAQDALHRLMEAQKMNNAGLAQWSDTVDEASDDAVERGLLMVREYTGDRLTDYLGDLIKDSDQESEQIYLRISLEKDQAKVGELQQEWEKLEEQKANLQETLERAKRVQETTDSWLDQSKSMSKIFESIGKNEGMTEKIRELTGDFLRKNYVQQAMGVSPEGSIYIKYAGSILDSSYDIFSEVLSAQRIKQLNQNANQFLQAQKALQHRIQTTIAKLNADKQTAPPGEATCSQTVAYK